MKNEKKDLWEIDPMIHHTRDCGSCKWEYELLENEVGDGGAPCRRCIHYGDDDWGDE